MGKQYAQTMVDNNKPLRKWCVCNIACDIQMDLVLGGNRESKEKVL